MEKILIVDDYAELRETVSILLERERFIPIHAVDGQSGLEKAFSMKPNLLIVDLRLPGLSGIEVCKQLRANRVTTPIIVLSAAADEVDKVLLLEMGADDYVVKPFGTREPLARSRALLRRTSPDAHKVFYFSDTEIDLDRRVVLRMGEDLKLTHAEY